MQPPPSPQVVRFAQQPQPQPQLGAVPMTPTQQPQKQQLKQQPPSKQQVDSSLFVTTPSLRRVEPNPAESPLKRTKLSEDDAMEFALGAPFPMTPLPLGRPRIPGPAGELMLSSARKKDATGQSSTLKSSQQAAQQTLPSPIITRGSDQAVSPTDPAQDVDFYNGPWLTMLEHLQLPPFTPAQGNALRFKFSIEYVLQDGWRVKVPQLVVVIKSIATDTNASVTLKDPTGEMQGTIHASVLDIHPNLIKRGAVLFLRQVSVFTPAPDSHYLNITDANIVHIFPQSLPHPTSLLNAKAWRHTFSPLEAYEGKMAPPRSLAREQQQTLGAGLAPRHTSATTARSPYATPKAARPAPPARPQGQAQGPPPPRQPRGEQPSQQRRQPQAPQRQPPPPGRASQQQPQRRQAGEALPQPEKQQPLLDDMSMDALLANIDMSAFP